jgi:hypothetical protein
VWFQDSKIISKLFFCFGAVFCYNEILRRYGRNN